jgi:hypothetical protein
VTLITGGARDMERLNLHYGTSLSQHEFSLRTVRTPRGLHRSAKFAGLRGASGEWVDTSADRRVGGPRLLSNTRHHAVTIGYLACLAKEKTADCHNGGLHCLAYAGFVL